METGPERRAHNRNLVMESLQADLFTMATALLVVLAVGILVRLGLPAAALLARQGPVTVLAGRVWDPVAGRYGLLPFLWGSAVVTAIALGVAVPLGGATAVTVTRILEPSWRGPARSLLTAFMAVPSVIYGWWGLGVVVPAVRALTGGPGFSLLAAGLTVGIMVLPTFALLAAEALAAVPDTWVQASLALGATGDQTLLRLVLPAAGAGLRQALALATARALGETLAVQMVVGGQTTFSWNPLHPGATLTSQILTDMVALPVGTPGHAALDVMAVVLLGLMWAAARAVGSRTPPPG
ncbi:Phosphate transport system permease protein PstC (TC 3.A.1.7.1) [Candidatus Hydrogenisulfobacillus filiaventi]|uniref:Phosphate transport system permease protein PstC (TC 3.A.1.7.1) n=1 Tax=Candidatus Hydrogenisulfobacillus filiaventi TaxID=2707344 RepID=A0A6F8ZIA7_9FIRM|nr:ABC transporter permease subunit [Bacillota bacterium]CAB1129727.1 Phosphate transport system permease protein PstC (TC 3.A.1.7.1) [Candidatus Hydrogenisulfobacillus filiaventi]